MFDALQRSMDLVKQESRQVVWSNDDITTTWEMLITGAPWTTALTSEFGTRFSVEGKSWNGPLSGWIDLGCRQAPGSARI
jgi:hypothetical protein